MARIAGVDLADTYKVDYALTKISGIGWASSKKVLESLGIDIKKRIKDLTAEEVSKIAAKLDEFLTEGDLAREVKSNVSRLQTIGSYRGVRHGKNLPVRGQRTRRNARTKRGKRKTIGAFKKEVLSKIKVDKKEGEK